MLALFRSALAAIVLTILAGNAHASQGSCVMPTTGTVSGLTLVNDINACNQALLSVYSGASAPGSPPKYMLWADTSTSYIKMWDGTAWITLWYVDETNHLSIRNIGGGSDSITAAATTDLGSKPQPVLAVNGTATITSFGSSAAVGSVHILAFTSSTITLVHNPATLFLPGAQNIAVTSGDVAFAFYGGGGFWQVLDYLPVGVAPKPAANTLSGNFTGAAAARQDVAIGSLTQKATPVGGDQLIISDSAAGGALKRVLASALNAISAVTSLGGQVGAFTFGNGVEVTGGNVIQLTPARRTLPVKTVLLSGTDLTYTTPANTLYLEIFLVAGGSGGGGGNNAASSGAGNQTCMSTGGTACGSAFIFANGGAASSYTVTGGGGGFGGGDEGTAGSAGSPGSTPGLNHSGIGGSGGHSCLGGGPQGSTGSSTGVAASANSGAGGGGGGVTNGSLDGGGGSGGASGGCVRQLITSPAGSYVYTVGTGGAGAAGASINSSAGGTGGAGGSGKIVIVAHFGT